MDLEYLLRQFLRVRTRYSTTAYRILEQLGNGSSKSKEELAELLRVKRLFVAAALWHLRRSHFVEVGKFQIEGEPERYTLLGDGQQFYDNAESEKDPITRRTVYFIETFVAE